MMMGIHTIQGDHGILQGHISHSCSQRVHNNTFRDEDPEESSARLKTIMQIVWKNTTGVQLDNWMIPTHLNFWTMWSHITNARNQHSRGGLGTHRLDKESMYSWQLLIIEHSSILVGQSIVEMKGKRLYFQVVSFTFVVFCQLNISNVQQITNSHFLISRRQMETNFLNTLCFCLMPL